MGSCDLLVTFNLKGFSGPGAVKRFNAQPFLDDLEKSLAVTDWSVKVEGEFARTFSGENTERFKVEQRSMEFFVMDKDTEMFIFGPTIAESVAIDVCDLLNQRYEDGTPT